MNPLLRSFTLFVKQIGKDSMLAVICFACVITAFFTRFGVPAIEQALCGYFHTQSILQEYYLLFDLLLAIVTPYMLCFASAMMMLTEYDENLSSYLAVTPVSKKGYILSRLLLPAGIAFVLSIVLMAAFSLTTWTLQSLLLICFLCSLSSIAVAMLMFSYSHNRVEGMAMGKLSGLLMLGLFVPFFLRSNEQYLFSALPSFWITKLCMEDTVLYLLGALVSNILWLWFLSRRFIRKIA